MTDATRLQQRWRRICWRAAIALVWTIASIHWTVRDSVSGVSLAFYAMPPILMGLVALFVAWIGRRHSTRLALTMNRATVLLGVFCLAEWALSDFRLGKENLSTDTITVVVWNVGRGHFADWDSIAKQALHYDADVIALIEATANEVQTQEFWTTRLPEHSAYPLPAGMVLLVKGSANELATGSLADRGDFCHLSVHVRDQRFDLLIADIKSDPLHSREQPIAALFDLMQKQGATPTFVVGDFNTPPTSVWFDPWRRHWTRAWEVAGSGYQPTWPQPLPVLAIDHIWGNEFITFHQCRCEWTTCSDHRPVTTTAKINGARRIEVTQD